MDDISIYINKDGRTRVYIKDSKNDISNLEIRNRGEHQKEHSTKYFDKIMKCPWCGKEFIWTGLQQRYYYSNIKKKEYS